MVRREDKNFDERYPRSESELYISPTLFIAAGEIKLSNIGNHEKNAKMGCICFENTEMGIYFIKDPDGYWLEIVPSR